MPMCHERAAAREKLAPTIVTRGEVETFLASISVQAGEIVDLWFPTRLHTCARVVTGGGGLEAVGAVADPALNPTADLAIRDTQPLT